jgi:hypothetical protein
MARNNAVVLFDKNIQSAKEMIHLYEGVENLGSSLNIDWLLRGAIVFAISAMDAYFHDKIKYRVGRFKSTNMPKAMQKFRIALGELVHWEKASRKGNVLRNWMTNYYSVRPLQTQQDIADAMSLLGIDDFWNKVEKNIGQKKKLMDELKEYTKRRNQIVHEGDREGSRTSGKKLRKISKPLTNQVINWVKGLVTKVEKVVPE